MDVIGHDHARVELVEAAHRIPIQASVHNYTGECLARPDRPRKTMVCPTFSQKCTNSSGGLPAPGDRRIANPPQVGNRVGNRVGNLPHKARSLPPVNNLPHFPVKMKDVRYRK